MDFDADGKKDMLSGCYPGQLYFFRAEADGKFAKAEILKHVNGKPIQCGKATTVFAHDWDGDADLDLLVGDIKGQVHLVPNEGSAAAPEYGATSLLKAGGKVITVPHGDSGPIAADWDGDGRADLLVGAGDGSVVFFRNTAGADNATAPVLAAGETIVPASHGAGAPAEAEESARPGTRAKICVTDWNADGQPDLLLGDFATRRSVAKALTESQKVRLAERKTKQQAWAKEYAAVQEIPADETRQARQERQQKVGQLIARFREIGGDEADADAPAQPGYQGNVWLYLRESAVAGDGREAPSSPETPATARD